jgi:hypothetical protein
MKKQNKERNNFEFNEEKSDKSVSDLNKNYAKIKCTEKNNKYTSNVYINKKYYKRYDVYKYIIEFDPSCGLFVNIININNISNISILFKNVIILNDLKKKLKNVKYVKNLIYMSKYYNLIKYNDNNNNNNLIISNNYNLKNIINNMSSVKLFHYKRQMSNNYIYLL